MISRFQEKHWYIKKQFYFIKGKSKHYILNQENDRKINSYGIFSSLHQDIPQDQVLLEILEQKALITK